jgi:hypothetical protein
MHWCQREPGYTAIAYTTISKANKKFLVAKNAFLAKNRLLQRKK